MAEDRVVKRIGRFRVHKSTPSLMPGWVEDYYVTELRKYPGRKRRFAFLHDGCFATEERAVNFIARFSDNLTPPPNCGR